MNNLWLELSYWIDFSWKLALVIYRFKNQIIVFAATDHTSWQSSWVACVLEFFFLWQQTNSRQALVKSWLWVCANEVRNASEILHSNMTAELLPQLALKYPFNWKGTAVWIKWSFCFQQKRIVNWFESCINLFILVHKCNFNEGTKLDIAHYLKSTADILSAATIIFVCIF